MKHSAKAVTLIEVMVVVAIISIVAMAASQAFKGSSQKIYLREAMNELAGVRLEVQSKYASAGRLPRTVQGLNNNNNNSTDNGNVVERRTYYNVQGTGTTPAHGLFIIWLTKRVLDVDDPYQRTLTLGWVESGRGDLIFLCGNYNTSVIFNGEHPTRCQEADVQTALKSQ
ncbi:type II secretion system protein [Sansalvadorimonas verongulae]|uniref:type II secretion system protein n=1 Tax=Sansalvadorimonas verongulae TaxID=2172824 RepID=UPI0012BD768A|nr:type II secretion system protein [Sansalvadorimonas verongulae]MTI12833.1 type II secretion system protein [Sansalvadorimonas verongulae]